MTSERRFDQDLPDLLAQVAPRRPRPTTETSSSSGPSACASGPPGPSPKGGSPCLPSRLVRPPLHGSRCGSWGVGFDHPPAVSGRDGLLATMIALAAGNRLRQTSPLK